MPITERTHEQETYRFGFNSQERDDNINGTGHINTAEFWSYDTRLGRRWNMDPIFLASESRYSVNANNPIGFLDPKGDFRTKFGAWLYNKTHGGDYTIQKNSNKNASKNKRYYVDKKVEDPNSATTYEKREHFGDVGETAPRVGDVADNLAGAASDYISQKINDNQIDKKLSQIWYSQAARRIVSDYYVASFGFQTSSGAYAGSEMALTLILRGKDPGLYWNNTTGGGAVLDLGVDGIYSVGSGLYMGDATDFSSSDLKGWQGTIGTSLGISVGVSAAVGVSIDLGIDDTGKPTTKTTKLTASAGLNIPTGIKLPAISIGGGKATEAVPIFNFKK